VGLNDFNFTSKSGDFKTYYGKQYGKTFSTISKG